MIPYNNLSIYRYMYTCSNVMQKLQLLKGTMNYTNIIFIPHIIDLTNKEIRLV